MTKREVHIVSYFSLPTDLAASMREWAKFKSGEEYTVDLGAADGEVVTVRRESGEVDYVAVVGRGEGHLFDRVLGRVVHGLAAHSDSLMIYRWDK
jgi:hypothetical protein